MDPLDGVGWPTAPPAGGRRCAGGCGLVHIVISVSRNGRLGDAMRWLDRMVGGGETDAMCYNTLVAGYAISVRGAWCTGTDC